MGVTTAGLIASRLIAAGFKPDLPVIAVENASRENERRVPPPSPSLPRTPSACDLNSPAVLIFGEVAGLPAAGLVEDVLSSPESEARLCLTSSPPTASSTASSSISPPTAAGSRRSPARKLAETEDETKALESEAAKAVAERRVVAVYPMEVALHDGVPVDPLSVRERIRAAHRTTLTKDWYDVPL